MTPEIFKSLIAQARKTGRFGTMYAGKDPWSGGFLASRHAWSAGQLIHRADVGKVIRDGTGDWVPVVCNTDPVKYIKGRRVEGWLTHLGDGV